MGFFTSETGWSEIAKALGVTEAYAKRLKDLMNTLPHRCAICREETNRAYLLRLSDAESPRFFGPVSDPKNCKVAMQRLCPKCLDELGDEGVVQYFKSRAAGGAP